MAGKPAAKGAVKKKSGPAKLLGSLYDISGGMAKRKNRSCPKCGPGMFMAAHSDRVVCGKCQYVEYNRK